jgi:hypothetical protein
MPARAVDNNGGAQLRHDLQEAIDLLRQHEQNGFAGLKYKAESDGAGGRTVTIHFPSASDAAKFDAMSAENGAVPAAKPVMPDMPDLPTKAASEPKVIVKVAMTREQVMGELRAKYPKKFIESIGISL